MKKGVFARSGIIVLIVVCATAYFTSSMVYNNENESVFSRKEVIADLSTTLVKAQTEHLAEHGVSLVSRSLLKDLVNKKDWSGALNNIKDIPNIFPEVDQLFIADTDGVLRAITGADQSIIGQDFSYRDWYKGITKDPKNWVRDVSYVSDVYQRANELKYNIILVATPIIASDGTPIGILGLQIKTDLLSVWLKDVKLDNGEFVYIVDKKGNIIFHPRYNPQADIVDYSGVPDVSRVIKGESGVGIFYNQIEQEERLSAYRQIPEYKWGVIVTQSSSAALSGSREHLIIFISLWILLFLLTCYFLRIINRYSAQLSNKLELEKIFLQSIGDGVVAIDRDWNITVWNKMAETLTGWKKEEVMGKPLRNFVKFIREDNGKENVIFIEEAMMNGEARNMENTTLLVRKDGTELFVGDSASPIFDYSGKITGATIIFRDVSKEVNLEKAKREIFYNTIHDLRGPSVGIRTFLEVYEDSEMIKKDPELLEDIRLVKDANTRMLDLISGLLNESRQHAEIKGKEFVHLSKIIDPAIKELAGKARKQNVSIEYISSTEWPPISINKIQATEIFTNLIDNAIKYNKDNGKVTIEHELKGGFMLTQIKDTGVGISKDNLNKLFTPYFRAEETSKIQGTGLGMSIVKKFIEDVGGNIAVDSEVGEGTTFTVSLPIKS